MLPINEPIPQGQIKILILELLITWAICDFLDFGFSGECTFTLICIVQLLTTAIALEHKLFKIK